MPNTLRTLCFSSTLALLLPTVAFSVEHPAGHGRSGGSGGQGCQKVAVKNIKPAPLTEVSAASEFSAFVIGANYPEDIEVTVKKVPITPNIEKKDDFYLVSGKLPIDLHNTAARVNIKVKGKQARCTEESGWLLKIIN